MLRLEKVVLEVEVRSLKAKNDVLNLENRNVKSAYANMKNEMERLKHEQEKVYGESISGWTISQVRILSLAICFFLFQNKYNSTNPH